MIENNKLIAEFMNYVLGVGNEINPIVYVNIPNWFGGESTKALESLHFDKDWNMLIQVVEKIESLEDLENFEISSNTINISYYINRDIKYNKSISYTNNNRYFQYPDTLTTKIEATYKAVVEFIKWYNENLKK